MKYLKESDKEIENAMVFLVTAIKESGHNPKSVILHSIRVGMYLYERGYDKEIVIAGLLHDLIEDTDTTSDQIASRFGKKVAELVDANTFNASITDSIKRYKENFERCVKAGKDALIIKAVDILDNSHFYNLTKPEGKFGRLLKKMEYFIQVSKNLLENEPIYQELENQYKLIKE